MALSVVRGMSGIWSLSDNNGHWPAMALNGSVANDPKRTKDGAGASGPAAIDPESTLNILSRRIAM